MQALAERALLPGEKLANAGAMLMYGLGEPVVVTTSITTGDDVAHSFFVDPSGQRLDTDDTQALDAKLYAQRYGKMSVDLFEQQVALDATDTIDVQLMVDGDFSEPELPPQTGEPVSAEIFQAWVNAHREDQRARLLASKRDLLAFLGTNGVEVTTDYANLPAMVARIPVAVLRSAELNTRSDIVEMDPVEAPAPARLLGDFAGWASMNESAIQSGCSFGCDGLGLTVGLWEHDGAATTQAGIALSNTRFDTSATATYENALSACSADSDCVPDQATQRCVAGHCVEDHLTWVAASLGMVGTYQYGSDPNMVVPLDSVQNAPSTTVFPSSGTYNVKYDVANDATVAGLNWLISNGVVWVNHSASLYSGPAQNLVDWAVRYEGVFFTQASGDDDSVSCDDCRQLHNGMCVGMYGYNTYSDASTHRRAIGSTWINSSQDTTLERPHLLGPGSHYSANSGSGLHLPNPKSVSGQYANSMCSEVGSGTGCSSSGQAEILGTSFAAPAVLATTLQTVQYEGFGSSMAIWPVNKAALLASAVDSNADGAVGKANEWSSSADAEDGSGHLDFNKLKDVLDNNRYFYRAMVNSDFVACGGSCREYTVAAVSLAPYAKMKVALAWNGCNYKDAQGNVSGEAQVANDFDLRVESPSECGGTSQQSVSNHSEVEIVQTTCSVAYIRGHTFTIKIRIKNGATLQACNGNTSEKVGVAWSFR